MSNGGTAVSRSSGSTGHNTINRRRIKIFFQRFPGTNAASGIAGLDFTVTVNGGPPVAGVTPADGKVEILLAAGDTATLSILGSQYSVSLLVGGLHPVTELRGVQQRLNMLGYNAGPLDTTVPPRPTTTNATVDVRNHRPAVLAGPNATPADRQINTLVEQQTTLETDLAILNFQADNKPLLNDGIPGPATQPKLRQVVQGAGGE